MAGKFKYPKAVIAFITAFAVFLVGMDVLLVSQERKKLYSEFENQAQNELVLIGTFVTEPILRHQYSVVEQFILQWGGKKPEILELEAFSPKKYSLAKFKRLSPQNHSKSFRHSVKFMDRNLLELVVVKSSSAIESHLQAFWEHLLFRSFFVLGVFGIILWFILQQFALRPLEQEVKRRRRAETELKKAHDHLESEVDQRTMELATEKELLSVTLRSIGDGVITTDVDGRIVLMNKMAETLTGWRSKDAVAQPLDQVFNIINVKTREPCESPVHKVIDTGQIIGFENHMLLIAKDGSQKNIADSCTPIRDKDSRIIGVVLAFRDTTDQLRMEQELMKLEKLESIGVLAGGIAHDFNNILAGILGNINLAVQDENLKNRTKEYLISAEKASLRAKDLTHQLLTFSKGGEPVKEISGLGNIIRNSGSFVLHGNKVNCRFDIPEDLWLVDIDKGQISQVIQNIVLNAGQAMPDGGTIEICCENTVVKNKRYKLPVQKGNYVKICIQDTGTGIPDDVIGKIFDPYFSTKKMGSGLGLAITHSIILKHGGYIFVESKLGGGTSFTIYLPSSTQQKPPNLELSAQNDSSKKAKILLMDDEEMVRTVTRSMLIQFGHDVVLCANGEEALKLYGEGLDTNNNFNLAIMDLTVPGGMGGQETAREILKMDPKARLIVSSGYSNNPVMASYEEYGFCGTIVKPYRIQELSKVINQVLAQNL